MYSQIIIFLLVISNVICIYKQNINEQNEQKIGNDHVIEIYNEHFIDVKNSFDKFGNWIVSSGWFGYNETKKELKPKIEAISNKRSISEVKCKSPGVIVTKPGLVVCN